MTSAKVRPCEEGTIRSIAPRPAVAKSTKFWVLLTAILGSTTAYIDESVVNVALPAIEQNLHAPVTVIQWIVNAYTLCLAALILIGGAAGDRFGRRSIFIIGTAIFALASF